MKRLDGLTALTLLLALGLLVGCGDDSGDGGGDGDGDGSAGNGGDGDGDGGGGDPIDPTYANIRERVFMASCAFGSCHDDTAPQGGLNLVTDPAAALVGVMATGAGAMDRTLVIAGNPDDSYIVEKVESMAPQAGVRMPPGAQVLEQNKIDALRAWIAAGAPTD